MALQKEACASAPNPLARFRWRITSNAEPSARKTPCNQVPTPPAKPLTSRHVHALRVALHVEQFDEVLRQLRVNRQIPATALQRWQVAAGRPPSKSAGTTTSKETGVDLQPITGLGGNAINIGPESIQLGVSSSNEFTGDAQANQSNSLNGSISVTVVDVLANQNLVIRGEKWLTLNHGDEYIRLTGIIRPADISPANEIVSTKIANARIQYSGTGSFARSQEKGWLTKFFSSEWWPM